MTDSTATRSQDWDALKGAVNLVLSQGSDSLRVLGGPIARYSEGFSMYRPVRDFAGAAPVPSGLRRARRAGFIR